MQLLPLFQKLLAAFLVRRVKYTAVYWADLNTL
jgi:hypothetical protein